MRWAITGEGCSDWSASSEVGRRWRDRLAGQVWAVRVSSAGPEERLPTVLLTGGHHAREPVSWMALLCCQLPTAKPRRKSAMDGRAERVRRHTLRRKLVCTIVLVFLYY